MSYSDTLKVAKCCLYEKKSMLKKKRKKEKKGINTLKTHINIYLQQLTTLHGTFSTRVLPFSDDIFENSN
jgi:hypothetical protein